MNRNVNSHFAYNPTSVDVPRSKWKRPHRHKTTFNAGELIPIYHSEILPGDTVSMDMSALVRMTTPVFPVMDDAFVDTFWFFIPNRLVWDHWQEFMGENKDLPWTQKTEYQVPFIQSPRDSNGDTIGWNEGSLGDYLGYPIKSNVPFAVSSFVLRSYVKVWNDWFRDENLMPAAYFQTGDNDVVGRLRGADAGPWDGIEDALYGGRPLQVSKYFDYFTGALPQPQKGDPVSVPVSGLLPVLTTDRTEPFSSPVQPLRFGTISGNDISFSYPYGSNLIMFNVNETEGEAPYGEVWNVPQSDGGIGDLVGDEKPLAPLNLAASADASNFSMFVNDVRLAFQLQKLLERDARGGTRYIELIKSHFGITSPDARLQRSEYLGGAHVNLNMAQVVQTSSTDTISPQGNVSGMSSTPFRNSSFVKSFTEHGTLLCVACVRTRNTYQQGLDKSTQRRRRFDYYWPVLANIGEQPIFKKNLYIPASLTSDQFDQIDEVFGYNEAWAEYRYHPDIVTGQFRSNADGSLDSWHYATYFNQPNLSSFVISDQFVYETDRNIQRTLAVDNAPQFFADFNYDSVWTRVMPLNSIPGMIDHF